MRRIPGFGIRVLGCERCAAPMEVPAEGGEVPCTACGHGNAFPARSELARVTFSASSLTDEERLTRLRAQDHKPLLPPDSLKSLVENGEIPEWKVQEARLVWLNTRKELVATSSFESAERLSFLTLLLANQLSSAEDRPKKRAMYESALEAFNLPRHRQMMLCNLASQAARNGDPSSAERWLALCDPRSDDLQADSYFRYARAILDTARGDDHEVLRVLGESYDQVPILDALDGMCAVLRANAWERLGQVEKAKAQLVAHMQAYGGKGQALLQAIAGNFTTGGQAVCARSLPEASAEYSQAAARTAGGIGASVGLFMMGVALLSVMAVAAGAVAAILGVDLSFLDMEKGEYWITFIGSGLMSLVPFGIGFRMWQSARKASRLRLHGLRGTGRIVRIERTGVTINDVPQVRLTLSVRLPDRPSYEATTRMLIPESSIGTFTPGTQVNVRVAPEDPSSVLVETM
jgi:hypothetical protein